MLAGRIGARRWVRVGDGLSGATVHRLEGGPAALYLKHGEGAAAALVRDEAARLEWLTGRMPASRLVAAIDEGRDAWLLTEALPGRSAGAWLSHDRGRTVQVATALVGFLRDLHALPVDDCPFDSSVAGWLPVVRRLVADGLVDTADFEPEHRDWTAAAVLEKVETLAGHARGRVVVHGDYSLGNLLLDDRGIVTGCVDVGRLGVGDPYRDIVIGWRDLGGFGPDAQQAFLDALGLRTLDPRRLELHIALDELF